MIIDAKTREQLHLSCGEVHEDDCVEPREYFKTERSSRGKNRKALQLCRQVAETLDLVFSGECRDDVLQNLYVQTVEPAPNASRLLVTVFADVPKELYNRQSILDLLDEQTGRLRYEIASAITRKRVPALVFNVIGSATTPRAT